MSEQDAECTKRVVERLKTAIKTYLSAQGGRGSADYWQGYADVLALLDRQVSPPPSSQEVGERTVEEPA